MATAHAHHHGHGHDHAHEHHGSERRVFWAALLTAGFMLAEVAGGWLAGSLALLADAAHMLTDAVSLGLAWFAFRIARQPADWRRTYGFDRFQILAAFTNGVVLFLVAAWIVAEAGGRPVTPQPVVWARGGRPPRHARARARRRHADDRGLGPPRQRRRLRHPARRRPREPERARRHPARAGRCAGLGRRHPGRRHHPGHRLDAGRPDPVGAGEPARAACRLADRGGGRPHPARGRARRPRRKDHRPRPGRERPGRGRRPPRPRLVADPEEAPRDAARPPRGAARLSGDAYRHQGPVARALRHRPRHGRDGAGRLRRRAARLLRAGMDREPRRHGVRLPPTLREAGVELPAAPAAQPDTETPSMARSYVTDGPAAVETGPVRAAGRVRRMSWGAALAGVAVLLFIQLMLSLLGVGIGLANVNPATGDNPSLATFGTNAGIFGAVSVIVATFLGAWASGRLSGSPSR